MSYREWILRIFDTSNVLCMREHNLWWIHSYLCDSQQLLVVDGNMFPVNGNLPASETGVQYPIIGFWKVEPDSHFKFAFPYNLGIFSEELENRRRFMEEKDGSKILTLESKYYRLILPSKSCTSNKQLNDWILKIFRLTPSSFL